MLQSIFGISQSLGLTEPTSQSIRLPDTTSQFLGLPKNISHSLGLPKKYFYFSHRLTEIEINVSVISASLYLISHINPSRNQLNLFKRIKLLNFAGVNCTIAKCSAIFSHVISICSSGEKTVCFYVMCKLCSQSSQVT